MPTYDELGLGPAVATRDRARAVFAHVMGLVALTVACAGLGAYVGRDMTGGSVLVLFLPALACMFGLQFAVRAGHEQLAVLLLFGMGFFLGLAVAPVLYYYAKAQPSVFWHATVATAAFVGGLGAYGYATRRDLSSWARSLFWALLALIGFGLVTLFISIPNGQLIYSVLGLGVFAALTIFDFNRLRRASMDSAVPIAAGIFLDVFNVFLFMLSLFGGGGNRR